MREATRPDVRGSLRSAIVIVAGTVLTACQSATRTPATFIEGPAGQPALERPSPLSATSVGTLTGGVADSDFAGQLADADRLRAAQAEHFALESAEAGRAQTWSGSASDTAGTIVVGERYAINRSECRDLTHSVTTSIGERVLRATACRQPDGTWRAVSG